MAKKTLDAFIYEWKTTGLLKDALTGETIRIYDAFWVFPAGEMIPIWEYGWEERLEEK